MDIYCSWLVMDKKKSRLKDKNVISVKEATIKIS